MLRAAPPEPRAWSRSPCLCRSAAAARRRGRRPTGYGLAGENLDQRDLLHEALAVAGLQAQFAKLRRQKGRRFSPRPAFPACGPRNSSEANTRTSSLKPVSSISVDGGGPLCCAQAPAAARQTRQTGHTSRGSGPHARAGDRGTRTDAVMPRAPRRARAGLGAARGNYRRSHGQNANASKLGTAAAVRATDPGVPGQDTEYDQHGAEAESDRCGRAQHDTDQNRERTHIFRLVYTWLAA